MPKIVITSNSKRSRKHLKSHYHKKLTIKLKNNNINVINDPKLPKNCRNFKSQKFKPPKTKIRQTLEFSR